MLNSQKRREKCPERKNVEESEKLQRESTPARFIAVGSILW